jgi:hypothetical protein
MDYRRSAGFATKANINVCFDKIKYVKTYGIFAMNRGRFDFIRIGVICDKLGI